MNDVVQSIKPHCDACGHTDEPVAMDKVRECIGMKCPKCAHVMVTEQDCDTLDQMVAAMRGAQALINLMGLAPKAGEAGEGWSITANTADGGKIIDAKVVPVPATDTKH